MTGSGAVIREAQFPADLVPTLAIVNDYLTWLGLDRAHRGTDAELAAFGTRFRVPSGLFVLAQVDGAIAGCGGLLSHPGNRAEVKRLFVRPAYRGRNLGEALMRALIARADALRATTLILDAVPQTAFAITLYERMGFTETRPFYENPLPGTRFLSLSLDRED